MTKGYFVYILASHKYGALYTGVTSDIARRVYAHRNALIPGFSSRYRTVHLVFVERHDDPLSAIARQKQIKKWRRVWKIELIEKDNPEWIDLYDRLMW